MSRDISAIIEISLIERKYLCRRPVSELGQAEKQRTQKRKIIRIERAVDEDVFVKRHSAYPRLPRCGERSLA
jgi:hypothetical protein